MEASQANYQNQFDFYKKHYSILVEKTISNGKKEYLGNRNKRNRKCRFCGKIQGDTTFNNLAHALPEFIGNKTLISNDECDVCNERFSRTLEDHFAKYLGLTRTLYQIPGKNGIPSFKDKNLKIVNKSELNMTLQPDEKDNRIVEIQEDIKQVSLEAKGQPYIPIAIYKCLTKMAISIMPRSELFHFRETLQWINMEKHSLETLNYPLKWYHAYSDKVEPFSGNIHTLLLRRKSNKNLVPYMIYVVAFGSEFFQIVVPCPKNDHKLVGYQNILLAWYPLAPYTTYPYQEYQYRELDLSSNEVVKDERFTLSMDYEKKLMNS